MEAITRDVKNIESHERHCLEVALGQSLQDNQKILIMAFTPNVVPDEATRREARENLDMIFDKAEAHASAQGITDKEIDAAVNDAMRQARGRKP